MKSLAIGMLLLGLVACEHPTSTADKRWGRLNNDEVYLVKGHEKVVHESPECPELKSARGAVIKCKVKSGRLMDESGLYMNGPDERLPLCNTCVR